MSPAVIQRLNWGWEIDFQDDSLTAWCWQIGPFLDMISKWTLECVLMTCVWLPPGKAIQELTVKAALALEHGCTIELVSQVRPDLTWKGGCSRLWLPGRPLGAILEAGYHNPGDLSWEKKFCRTISGSVDLADNWRSWSLVVKRIEVQ